MMVSGESDPVPNDAGYELEGVTSNDIRSGYLTGPGVDRLPVQYGVVDGLALFEGCIELGPVDAVEAEATYIRTEDRARLDPSIGGGEHNEDAQGMVLHGVGIPGNSQFLWPQGRVPFAIANTLPNQARVTNAIAHIEARAPIRFIQRTAANASQHPNWVEFIPHASVNSSPVGMRGGRQQIRLSPGATVGTVVHEILHSLGIYHEQSRSDRDDFIEIRWQNIQDNAIHNFQTVPGTVDYYDYDYSSIMHYPRWAFAIDTSKDTIVPRQAGETIGQRDGLSFGDRLTIAKMYERFSTPGYSGVWRAQSGRYGLWANASWESFQAKWQEWSNDGLRLIDIHTRLVGNQTRYSGVFVQGTGKHALWANSNFDSFQSKWREWAGQGLRLVGLHIHRVGNENRYSGVWLAGTGAYALWANASWDSFRAKWEEWARQGLRLVDLHVQRVNNQDRYSGVWMAGTDRYALWANATWDSFRGKWQEWGQQGLRLVDMNVHTASGQNRYSGVWRAGSGGYHLWANVTWENFRAKWEQLAASGFRLVDFEFPVPDIGGQSDPDMAGLAAAAEQVMDPALEEDGVGGLFGEDVHDLYGATIPMAAAFDPVGVGGLVGDDLAATVTAAMRDGEGGIVLAGTGPASDHQSVDEATEAVGGMGAMETAEPAAEVRTHGAQEDIRAGGIAA